ncbi:TorF family putative porin [Neptuniibacter sp. UBA6509]|uniref:TorF family putative porin n=1 Tax=Neptuniibacter sp. UBA6509 TaxID=1946976 RepID=UPI0025E74179|nr:TorF family putative porin [Neptuniibacter sp. UBA6509]
MMKSTTKTLIAAGLLSASVMAEAGLSANIGAMSDYYFRGVDQTTGASMMGGVDYEADNGIYVGLWAADLSDDDVEYDIYGGYAGEAGDISYSLGYTGYFYTESDVDFHELNLNLGYSFFNLEVTLGTEDQPSGTTEADYSFVGLTGEYEGAYLTYGTFGKDYDGDYVELGYGMTYEGLDMNLAYINPDDTLGNADTVTFSISKSFDF